MKAAEKILHANCGINYFVFPNTVHATVNDVLIAMEEYAIEYSKKAVKEAYNNGYSSCSSDRTANMQPK